MKKGLATTLIACALCLTLSGCSSALEQFASQADASGILQDPENVAAVPDIENVTVNEGPEGTQLPDPPPALVEPKLENGTPVSDVFLVPDEHKGTVVNVKMTVYGTPVNEKGILKLNAYLDGDTSRPACITVLDELATLSLSEGMQIGVVGILVGSCTSASFDNQEIPMPFISATNIEVLTAADPSAPAAEPAPSQSALQTPLPSPSETAEPAPAPSAVAEPSPSAAPVQPTATPDASATSAE
ncbi:MAG: hypothetical protein ACOYJB_08990 [Christensenellaceae bacterium]|jgi:hypothetical protein